MLGSQASQTGWASATMADLANYRVDGWLVQPDRNCLTKGETIIRVRPQLIDVLGCLAAHAGRVVSKEQLLATVWNDRFVAESGVARCMAELRQLLADDARQPRIIETIPKRGYRLIAQVERQEPVAVPAMEPPASALAPGGTSAPTPLPFGLRAWPLAAVGTTVGTLVRHCMRAFVG